MYIHVQFGMGQSKVFATNVRSLQLMSHIRATCGAEFRHAMAAAAAQIAATKPAADARRQKLRDYLAQIGDGANSTAAGEAEGTDEPQQEELEHAQNLRQELQTLEEEALRTAFLEEKIQEGRELLLTRPKQEGVDSAEAAAEVDAQQASRAAGAGAAATVASAADDAAAADLFLNGNLVHLAQGGDRYACEPAAKGDVSIPLEPKQTYVLFVGDKPLLLPQTPEEENQFSAKYKAKNAK